MRRNVARRALGVLLLSAGPAVTVAGDEPPTLSGPSPSAATPTSTSSPAGPAESRPMLVLPGINAPGRIHSRTSPLPPLEPAGPSPGLDEAPMPPTPGGVPELIGPAFPSPVAV